MYPAGLAADAKELDTGGRPNGEGVGIQWVIGPRAALSSPWTNWTRCTLIIAHRKKEKVVWMVE